MSLRLGNLSGVQEILVLALMLVSIFAFFSDIELTYKIGIAALAFSVIFLTSLATQLLNQEKEKNR